MWMGALIPRVVSNDDAVAVSRAVDDSPTTAAGSPVPVGWLVAATLLAGALAAFGRRRSLRATRVAGLSGASSSA